MLTYEWISMITLGKDRWNTQQDQPKPYEAEREAARQRHADRDAAKPSGPPGLLQRLFSRQCAYHLPQPPRPVPPHKQASRV